MLSKVILIGELAGLARYPEHKPLIIFTVLKAGMFTVRYVFFHVLEQTIHGLVHGETFLHSVAIAGKGVIPARAWIVFFAFIPFFALFETRRVWAAALLSSSSAAPKSPREIAFVHLGMLLFITC